MSLRQLLTTGRQFVRQLELHHGIEEAHIYPHLAPRMPEFAVTAEGGSGGGDDDSDSSGAAGGSELLRQHRDIHAGMGQLDEYLAACQSGESDFRLPELKSIMDGFGKVLWEHLDDEVKQLGADRMRRHWTLQEMKMMPM